MVMKSAKDRLRYDAAYVQASWPKHLKSRLPGAMPIKVLRDTVDLVIKSGLRKPQELIQEIHEPVSVLWQEYFPSFEHWRNNRQSYNFVTSRCDGNGADAVALPQIMPGQGGGSSWVEQENFNQIESAINQLQISINDLSYQVGRVLSALNKGQAPNALTIDVPNQQIITKQGDLVMSGIAMVTSNYNLRIALIWKDAIGVAMPPASGNTQASSSNLSVVPEVDVADDDLSIVVRVAALGSSFITVSNGGITNIIA